MLCCPGDTEDLVASHTQASEGPYRDLVYPPLTKPSKTFWGGEKPHPCENGISQQKSSLGGHRGLLQLGRHKLLSRCIFVLFSPQSTQGTHGWDHPLLVALQYPTKGSSHHPKTPLSPSAPHNRQPWRALNNHRTLHPCWSPGQHPPWLSTPLGRHNGATRFGKPFFREKKISKGKKSMQIIIIKTKDVLGGFLELPGLGGSLQNGPSHVNPAWATTGTSLAETQSTAGNFGCCRWDEKALFRRRDGATASCH